MRRFVLIALGLAFWSGMETTAHAQASMCARREAQLGAEVRTARGLLTRIHVGDMEETVTPEASAAIEALKDRIVDFVTGTMHCIAPNAAPANIQRLLAARGDAFEDRTHHSLENYPNLHGNGLAYEVARPPGQPALVLVVARVDIECGDDAVLMLFERARAGWRLSIIRRSAPYREINGAFGYFRYALSAPDRRGRWYLAIGRVPPWCTSNWRGVVYDLSRPGPAPERPRIFFSRTVGTYIGNDLGAGDFRAEPNRFQVRHDGGIANVDVIVRRHVETYAVNGDMVRRIQPAAFNPRDFADEWVESPWSEAASWSAPDAAISEAHRQLHNPLPNGQYPLGPIHRCSNGLHQVMVGEGQVVWYLFVQGNGPFRMVRAARASPHSCGGPDLRDPLTGSG